MAPRTRTKLSKASKENINSIAVKKTAVVAKTKSVPLKPQRKPLGDKTNSASDDESVSQKTKMSQKVAVKEVNINLARPRRDRRLPSRFADNDVIRNLSTNNNNTPNKDTNDTSSSDVKSPFKTPQNESASSMVMNRPRRIHRVPSKFDEHSISPLKFIPMEPRCASTPITKKTTPMSKTKFDKRKLADTNGNEQIEVAQSKPKTVAKITTTKETQSINEVNMSTKRRIQSKTEAEGKGATELKEKVDTKVRTRQNRIVNTRSTRAVQKMGKTTATNKNSDNNNNPENISSNMTTNDVEICDKQAWPNSEKSPMNGRNKCLSYRLLEEKKSPKEVEEKLAVYDFTFDPSEEPAPQKKKRKRAIRKKAPPKPKIFVMKNNYDAILNKTLETLKSVVSKKTGNLAPAQNTKSITPQDGNLTSKPTTSQLTDTCPATTTTEKEIHIQEPKSTSDETLDNDNFNYSPITSPIHPENDQHAVINETRDEVRADVLNDDPLNLQKELDFFDEEPVASSSLNVTNRHPEASPWRAQYENLPIKWGVNAYVKPNMTPAYESSFLNFNDGRKKHVYANISTDDNVGLPDNICATSKDTNWKQSSIISFFKEAVDKSAQKRKKCAVTPTKANSIFNDSNTSIITDIGSPVHKTPSKAATTTNKKDDCNDSNTPNKDSETEMISPITNDGNAVNRTPLKRKSDACELRKDDVVPSADNFFGFDESGDNDQENVLPSKDVGRKRARTLRPRSKAVLREINQMARPSRAKAAKPIFAPTSEVVNNLYEEMKMATDTPAMSEKDDDIYQNTEVNCSSDSEDNMEEVNEDSQPIPLFEDVEVFYHNKPVRKSYGKAKKVTFRHGSDSDIDTHASDLNVGTEDSDHEDLADLTFKMPIIKTKKPAKKKTKAQKQSKKEDEEAEAWAAGFNSMCEDVDGFDLVFE